MDGFAPDPGRLALRLADFDTLTEALDYGALGDGELSFNRSNGEQAETLSYRELRQRAIGFARALAARFPRGAHIGLVAETSADFLTAFMACQYSGLVPAPVALAPAIGGREAYMRQLDRMWEAARMRAILVPGHLRDIYDGLGDVLPIEAGSWPASPDTPVAPATPGDPCYIQFSSGSTSDPKGIIATQASVVANCRAITRHGLKVRPGDRAVSWLPLYHDMGLVGFFIAPMMAQLCVDYLPASEFARRPISWLKLISSNRATLAYSPSFGYELCVRRYRGEALDLSCWRAAGIGGDMVRESVLADFADCFRACGFDDTAFVASYGLAESTLAVSFAPLGEGVRSDRVDAVALRFDEDVRVAAADRAPEHVRNFVLCGKPVPGHEVRISPASKNDLPDRNLPERTIGRIRVRGPSVASGRYDRERGTVPLVDADGWLDTGDLGYWLDGQIVVTGRWKDLIIFNGRNIWPQDIEWTVQEASEGKVARCVVIDASRHSRGDRIVVLAEYRGRDETAREGLRRELGRAVRVATGAPVEIVLVAPRRLPVTSSGKLSRAAARKLFLSDQFEPVSLPG